MPTTNEQQQTSRVCQNCKAQFTIGPDDFDFYKKIDVPSPTFCPDCRFQRRLAFRNERSLYRRVCDLCKQTIISAYSSAVPFPVYCQNCWWSDRWDPKSYAKGYDFSRSFFEQFKELQNIVPRQHQNNYSSSTLVNSEYTNCSGELKNCYLVFGSGWNEDCLYCHYTNNSKSCVDTLYALKDENCYECIDIHSCNGISYSHSCVGCQDSKFLFDCRNCSDCLGCVGLRNKKHHIFNVPYSKDDYLKKKSGYALHTRTGIRRFSEEYSRSLLLSVPRKYYHGQMNKESTGDYLSNSENAKESFYTQNARNSRFCYYCMNGKDTYDFSGWGDVELVYETISSGENAYNVRFCHTAWAIRDCEYSSLCFSASNLLGCIGIRGGQFCILNKQYEEGEYRRLAAKIRQQMSEKGYKDLKENEYRYGEFFPIEHSPFSYLGSMASEFFPLTEEEIAEGGYPKNTPDRREYATTKKPKDLPETIGEVEDSVLNEVLECSHGGTCEDQCTTAFKITGQELAFYRKMDIPLPVLCHNCRHAERVRKRNPLKLWHRACMCEKRGHSHAGRCPNEFETSYSPDRKEIVYCEQCYNAEVV